MLKLSISIFAYKQIAQIKAQLDEIVSYDGNDIEVVISDDTPDDSVKSFVESYKDDRFRYVKNGLGVGADGNYLNAIDSAEADYVWIFRSSDCANPEMIDAVINAIDNNRDCALYFFSTVEGKNLVSRSYDDKRKMVVWSSGTLHPSGYVINKKYCDFELYKKYILEYFGDYKASNVAFSLLQADLGLKGPTFFSSVPAWKYAVTVQRDDKATNSPGGKNPFGLELEYKRYALMLDFASSISNKELKITFVKKVIHVFAKQILHIFGKRNSSEDFLKHYGCESVEFNPLRERKIFISESIKNLNNLEIDIDIKAYIKRQAFIYGIIKPAIYKIRKI